MSDTSRLQGSAPNATVGAHANSKIATCCEPKGVAAPCLEISTSEVIAPIIWVNDRKAWKNSVRQTSALCHAGISIAASEDGGRLGSVRQIDRRAGSHQRWARWQSRPTGTYMCTLLGLLSCSDPSQTRDLTVTSSSRTRTTGEPSALSHSRSRRRHLRRRTRTRPSSRPRTHHRPPAQPHLRDLPGTWTTTAGHILRSGTRADSLGWFAHCSKSSVERKTSAMAIESTC